MACLASRSRSAWRRTLACSPSCARQPPLLEPAGKSPYEEVAHLKRFRFLAKAEACARGEGNLDALIQEWIDRTIAKVTSIQFDSVCFGKGFSCHWQAVVALRAISWQVKHLVRFVSLGLLP